MRGLRFLQRHLDDSSMADNGPKEFIALKNLQKFVFVGTNRCRYERILGQEFAWPSKGRQHQNSSFHDNTSGGIALPRQMR
jgi:hypothetical protein